MGAEIKRLVSGRLFDVINRCPSGDSEEEAHMQVQFRGGAGELNLESLMTH